MYDCVVCVQFCSPDSPGSSADADAGATMQSSSARTTGTVGLLQEFFQSALQAAQRKLPHCRILKHRSNGLISGANASKDRTSDQIPEASRTFVSLTLGADGIGDQDPCQPRTDSMPALVALDEQSNGTWNARTIDVQPDVEISSEDQLQSRVAAPASIPGRMSSEKSSLASVVNELVSIGLRRWQSLAEAQQHLNELELQHAPAITPTKRLWYSELVAMASNSREAAAPARTDGGASAAMRTSSLAITSQDERSSSHDCGTNA